MKNTYLLEKEKVRLRRILVNAVCRTVTVVGFLAMVLLPGGIEQGIFGVGIFLILEVLAALTMAAGALGTELTYVHLPLDGGEEE